MEDKCRFCESEHKDIDGMYFFGYFICRHCLEKIQKRLEEKQDKAGE